jgi:hypothetical protein
VIVRRQSDTVGEIASHSQVGYPGDGHDPEELIATEEREFRFRRECACESKSGLLFRNNQQRDID